MASSPTNVDRAQQLWVTCLLFHGLFLLQPVHPHKCRPAEEGKMFNLHCKIIHNVGIARDLQWEVVHRNGSSMNVSRCFAGNMSCINYHSKQFHAKLHELQLQPGMLSSRLDVVRVSSSHNGVIIRCVETMATDKAPGSVRKVLNTCRVETYRVPTTPKCTSRLSHQNNNIRITCSTKNVAPSLVCEFSQFEITSRSTRTIPNSNITYLRSNDDDDRCCETNVYLPIKGRYIFYVNAYPKVTHGNKRVMSVSGRTKKSITIERSMMYVSLRKDDLKADICFKRKQEISLRCDVFGFVSEPELMWYIDNRPMPNDRVSSKKDNYEYESTLTVEANMSLAGREFTCEANNSEFGIWAKHTFRADFRWPPPGPPVFLDSIGNEAWKVVIAKGPTRFRCEVRGGQPEVSETSVICTSSLDGPRYVVYLDTSAQWNRVDFKVNVSKDESWKCICTATHPTQCYHETSELLVRFTDAVESSGESSKNTNARASINIAVILIIVMFPFVCSLTSH